MINSECKHVGVEYDKRCLELPKQAAQCCSGSFVFRKHLRRSLHVLSGKVRFSGPSLWWGFISSRDGQLRP